MALINQLNNLGDAIRERTSTTEKLTLEEMAEAVKAIPYPVVEEIAITENGTYTAPTGVDGYSPIVVAVPIPEPEEPVLEAIEITENGEYSPTTGVDGFNLVTVNVASSGDGEVFNELTWGNSNAQPFQYNTLNTWIDGKTFTINASDGIYNIFSGCSRLVDLSKMVVNYTGQQPIYGIFESCNVLTKLPTINATKQFYSTNYNGLFRYCYALEEIPAEFWDSVCSWSSKTTSNIQAQGMFSGCRKLKALPDLHQLWDGKYIYNSNTAFYATAFYNCYSLKEIVDVPVLVSSAKTLTTSVMTETLSLNWLLKRFTFSPVESVQWSGQTLNINYYVGYTGSNSNTKTFLKTHPELADKQVTDDATYQALKNDPDWWTQDVNYSRYNHDSAVETINSLPDTSAYLATTGKTNTIKFKGAAGALTDGGAINTMTEEEIAVATAKGWTVTLS